MEEIRLPVFSCVTKYEKICRIGEGTYGVVYKARNRETGEIVALKKVRMERERDGMPVTAVREMRVLQNCQHKNLVALKEVVTGSKPDSTFLVFEFCAHDLGRLLDSLPLPFTISEIKCLLEQLLEGLAFLHSRWVMHRDIKLSNLLLTRDGKLKLCDFGLARYFRPFEQAYTPRVITLWYRAPEVLLGVEEYTEAVDMWSVGAVFGELLKHEPLFPGKTEMDMLDLMSALLGTPSDSIWPGFSRLPGAANLSLPAQPYNYLRKTFPRVSELGIDLLNRMLTYDPERRLSARSALRHPFFQEVPLAKAPEDMPTFPSQHSAPAANKRHALRVEADAEDRGFKRVRGGNGLDDRFGEAFGDSLKPSGMRQTFRHV